ncbi:MAG: AMP-binding protein [Planctomycetota bacterium]|jgi:acyl-CoA synthetase (AMP-forming)/AMP-acid ligase II|nr:AMP-binding protein [Planctomycetota bacterium]
MAETTAILEVVKRRSLENGDQVFLVDPVSQRNLTFSNLIQAVQSIQASLQAHGFSSGDRVLLMFNNGVAAAVSFLAVTASGGVAVPTNPEASDGDIIFIRKNSGARFVLTSADLTVRLDDKMPDLRRILELPYDIRLYIPLESVSGDEVPEDLAIILYTSGATGIPKGVMLTHLNLMIECDYLRQAYRFTNEDRALAILPPFHITGLVMSILTPLLVGMRVVMLSRFSASNFWDWIGKHQITWFNAAPTLFAILLAKPIPRREAIPSLRFMCTDTFSLPGSIQATFENRTGVPLIEAYSLTESGGQITANPLPPARRKPGSVGIPFGNMVSVFLPDGNPAPSGYVGEVAVSGRNVALGYFANPQGTAQSFRDNWFFTGDLGFMDSDGYLFLQGRSQELINRAGDIISPQEIDKIIMLHPLVAEAAAVGVPHPIYGEEIVAFYRPPKGHNLGEMELKNFCVSRLSPFKMPKRFYLLEAFPLGPEGNIQRLKLVALYKKMPENDRVV